MGKLIIVLIAIVSMPLYAGEYKEIRELTLDANNLEGFFADVTSGYLRVTGSDEIDQIIVKATIRIDTKRSFDDDDARDYAENKLTLTLKEKRNKGVLVANFDQQLISFSNFSRVVDLDIQVPSNLQLRVDDGSGLINISKMKNGVNIDDGSGALELTQIDGKVYINDGSGSIDVDQVNGDVTIEDGSGSLSVTNVQGDLSIDDGSGNIDVADIIGSVSVDDGSGSIKINNVSNDFILLDDGSGGVSLAGVQGDVRGYKDRKRRRDLK